MNKYFVTTISQLFPQEPYTRKQLGTGFYSFNPLLSSFLLLSFYDIVIHGRARAFERDFKCGDKFHSKKKTH